MRSSIDELLDQLQAQWLSAIEFGRPTGQADHVIFRISFGPTIAGMQFSLARLKNGAAEHAMYFNSEAREELKQQIAILIQEVEQPDAVVVPLRERTAARAGKALAPVHQLYAVNDERRHSAG